MSSMQVCHCGWSNVTTYHGLRIHQGKMGCTQRGMSIPEREQIRLPNYITSSDIGSNSWITPVRKEITNTSDKSMQMCDCGWSNVTTYHGLRTHQGMMGCAQRGMSIPEREQIRFPNYITSSNIGSNSWITLVQKEITNTSDKSMQMCYCGWSNVTTYQGLRTHQGMMGCTPRGMETPESEQFRFTGYKYTNADSGPSIKIDNTLTPPYHSKTHQNTNNVRRALDFSTGAQQLQQVEQYWELPTTSNNHSSRPTAFQLKEMEKEMEAQKSQEMRQDMIRADLQQKMQTREQKISEVTSSVKACMGGLDAECLEINSVFSEVMKVVEDSWQEALQPLEERRQRVSREGKDQVKKLQKEIDKIFQTIDEWEENGDWQGLPKTGLDDSRDWKHLTVDTSFSFGSLRATTSSMMEKIHQELEKLSSVEPKMSRTPTLRHYNKQHVNLTNLLPIPRSTQPPPMQRHLRAALLNTRSINNKSNILNKFIKDNNLDFLYLTETWQKPQDFFLLNEITPAGFTYIDKPRPLRGGGIAAIIRKEIKTIRIPIPDVSSFEHLIFKLSGPTPLVTAIIYRTPKSNPSFLSDLSVILTQLSAISPSVLLLGDFNIHVDDPTCKYASEFKKTLHLFHFSQHINFPTHCGGHTLDLVCSTGLTIHHLSSLNLHISDHLAIIMDINIPIPEHALF
ncbi:uncharacterized protein LOC117533727 isoform X3 [Gymnodraco acuticeps]|uniref:Uncharacterized protein LOC117533727 isoform X3 n=1 Tax=Gymnodraco acuticeps TaxID=8218 RepID=A0A6P8T8B9_GYMAC|nr:uncharacterized protein LOC117533727 isoform X3 [Gymnodraco acuticeps]